MRTILLLVLLAACGGDSVHDVIDCATDSGYPIGSKCERACAAGPACASNDTACLMTLPASCPIPGSVFACTQQEIAAYDGAFGCCRDSLGDNRQNVPLWTECE